MPHHIELANSPPTHTAVGRERVLRSELPRFVPAACGDVWSFIRSAKLPQPGRHVALYLEDGTVEVGAEVGGPFSGNGRIHSSQLPSGPVATATHFGPYGRLSQTHAAIRDWCDAQGRKRSSVCWEIYGHWQESWNTDPAKIRTDIYYLLDGKGG